MMKFNYSFGFTLISLFLLISCGPVKYYQVQEFKKVNKESTLPENTFKNNDLQIEYDFWSRNGFSDFKISNHSDSLIFIDLEMSHFAMNGLATPYYNNQIQMESSAYLSSRINTRIYGYQSNGVKYETSNTYIPSKILVIPPHTHKMIKGFNIALLYKDCNLKHFTDSSSIVFSHEFSPVKLKNLFYYTKGIGNKEYQSFENELSLSSVVNVIQNKFYYFDYKYECNQRASYYALPFSRFKSNNRIYLEYFRVY